MNKPTTQNPNNGKSRAKPIVPPHSPAPEKQPAPFLMAEHAPALEGDQPTPVSDELLAMNQVVLDKAAWSKLVSDAKAIWGKLSVDELLKSQGRTSDLVVLVQERYAVSEAEANIQVMKFLQAHRRAA